MAAAVIALELNAVSIVGSVVWSVAIWNASNGGNSFGFLGIIFFVIYGILLAMQSVLSVLPSLIVAGSGTSLTPQLVRWVRRSALAGLALTVLGFAAVFIGLLARPAYHSPP